VKALHRWTLAMSTITLSSTGQHWTPPPGFADAPPPSSLSRPLSVHICNIMFTTSTRFPSTTINNSYLCHLDHLPGTVCMQMTSISIVCGMWNHFIIFYVYTAFFYPHSGILPCSCRCCKAHLSLCFNPFK